MNINRLSKQTIEELAALVSHFDHGAEIHVNHDDNEIQIIGVDNLNEQGNIQIRRCYDFSYGMDCNNKFYNTSHEMIEQIQEDDKFLKKADLYTKYENAKEFVEDQEFKGGTES